MAAIEAVAEVGNPTIVATLTVVAALLRGIGFARFEPRIPGRLFGGATLLGTGSGGQDQSCGNRHDHKISHSGHS